MILNKLNINFYIDSKYLLMPNFIRKMIDYVRSNIDSQHLIDKRVFFSFQYWKSQEKSNYSNYSSSYSEMLIKARPNIKTQYINLYKLSNEINHKFRQVSDQTFTYSTYVSLRLIMRWPILLKILMIVGRHSLMFVIENWFERLFFCSLH